MLQELISESMRASGDQDWDSMGDLIHQWKESASLMQSGVLHHAMSEQPDEQPLTVPALEGEAEACDSEL